MIGIPGAVFHKVQCLTVLHIAGVHLTGCFIVSLGLIGPAAAIADGSPEEIPLCIVIAVVGQQGLCPAEIAAVDGQADLLQDGAAALPRVALLVAAIAGAAVGAAAIGIAAVAAAG